MTNNFGFTLSQNRKKNKKIGGANAPPIFGIMLGRLEDQELHVRAADTLVETQDVGT